MKCQQQSTRLVIHPRSFFLPPYIVYFFLFLMMFPPKAAFGTELIVNGSFDSGTSGWTVSGNFWAGTNLSNWRTSSGYASGGVNSSGSPINYADGSMYQTISIPSNAASASLSFWYNITTNESVAIPADYLNVYIQSTSGSTLATVAQYSNVDKAAGAGSGYYSQKTFDMSPYIGQTVRVFFSATSDYGDTTIFRIDDVSVTYTTSASDLVITGSIGVSPNPVAPSGSIMVSYTVKNQGNGNAASSTTRIQVKNASNYALLTEQYFTTSTISAGSSASESRSISIPSTTSSGSYNVYVILDYNNAIGQSNPDNDIYSYSGLTIQTPIATSTTLSVTVNGISGTVGQAGNLGTVKLYDTSSNLISSQPTANAVSTFSSVTPGTYHYIAVKRNTDISPVIDEYWGQKLNLSVSGTSMSSTLTRYMPWASTWQLKDITSGSNVLGGTVSAGAIVRPEITIANDDPSYSHSVTVEVLVETSTSVSVAFTETKTVAASNSATFSFTGQSYTMSSAGTYSARYNVKVALAASYNTLGGQTVFTDSGAWSTTVAILAADTTPPVGKGWGILPKTGQTTCYNSSGSVISCTGTRQDGDIQAGAAWPDPRFTDNGDGTITDNHTGLIWQKDGNVPMVGSCAGGTKTWQGALDYVACLNTNNYLGHNDWRVPNKLELESLVNAGQSNQATWLNAQGFTNTRLYYWSSSTDAYDTGNAWGVDFSYGYVNDYNKTYTYYVRCVRGGQNWSFGNLGIWINNGASSTNSQTVTLRLSAIDDNGVAQMQFSNDNSSWLTPETYATSKSWTLSSGAGTKTVYVKFKDYAGNWSEVYSDTIILNVTALTPVVSYVTPSTIAKGTSYQYVTISGSNFTSASYHEFSIDGGTNWGQATSAPIFNSPNAMTVAVSNRNEGTVLVKVCASKGSTTCSGSIAVTISTVTSPSTPKVVWSTPPPSTMISGRNYNLGWNISSGTTVTHTNVHFDTIADLLSPSICAARASCQAVPTPARSGAAGMYGETITAPTVTTATTYFFAAHAAVDGTDILTSPTVTVTVNPSCPAPVASLISLEVGTSASSCISKGNVQLYGFSAQVDQAYAVTLTPQTGDPDLYLSTSQSCAGQGPNYNLVCNVRESNNSSLMQDKISLPATQTGTYYIAVYGASDSRFTLNISAQPVAFIDANNNAPNSGETVTFTGAGSLGSSTSCGITSFSWDFGDGNIGSEKNITHAFTSYAGTVPYTVSLMVTDCNGHTDTRSMQVNVTGQAMGMAQKTSFSVDPVNLATGNYTYEHTDLTVLSQVILFKSPSLFSLSLV